MSFDKPTAKKIKNLLEEKHSDDIIVTECKMGSAGSRILDAWVMKKTWSPRTTIGYEIKVSRSDFLQDEKWREYLDVCHEFYFVCPWGLIDKKELPAKVGLMWSSKNGTRLYTRRKAVRNSAEPDVELLYYILMHRVKITESSFGISQLRHNKKRYWEAWLRNRKLDQDFGRMVSQAIRKEIREKIDAVEIENRKIKSKNMELEHLQEKLDELNKLGIRIYDLNNIIKNGVAGLLQNSIGSLRNDLKRLKRSIEDVEYDIKRQAEKITGEKEATDA